MKQITSHSGSPFALGHRFVLAAHAPPFGRPPAIPFPPHSGRCRPRRLSSAPPPSRRRAIPAPRTFPGWPPPSFPGPFWSWRQCRRRTLRAPMFPGRNEPARYRCRRAHWRPGERTRRRLRVSFARPAWPTEAGVRPSERAAHATPPSLASLGPPTAAEVLLFWLLGDAGYTRRQRASVPWPRFPPHRNTRHTFKESLFAARRTCPPTLPLQTPFAVHVQGAV